jgi:hypothetical protein
VLDDVKKSTGKSKEFQYSQRSAKDMKNTRLRQLFLKAQMDNSEQEEFMQYFEVKAIKFVRITDFLVLLGYFESSKLDWHISRGFSKELQGRSNLLVMTNNSKLVHNAFQEYHSYDCDIEG